MIIILKLFRLFCNSWERQRYFHFTNQLLPDLIIMCTEGEVFQLIDRNEYQPQKFMILWQSLKKVGMQKNHNQECATNFQHSWE